MTSFEVRYFKELRQMENSKKPQNLHLCIQNDTYGIYFINSADNKQLWKTTDKGINVDQIDIDHDNDSGDNKSTDYDVRALWHDRTNNILYGIDCDRSGNIWDSHQWSLWKVILSTDTFSEHVQYTTMGETFDVFTIPSDGVHPYCINLYEVAGAPYPYYLYIRYPITWGITDSATTLLLMRTNATHVSWKVSYVTVDESDNIYFLCKFSDEDVKLWKAIFAPGAGSVTELYDFGANSDIPTSWTQRGISYDGSDILYCIIEDTSDSKNYLWTYSIGDDTGTKGSEFDVSLMLDKNCVATSNSPWEFEKAIHISDPYIYQIHKGYEYLLKIQNLDLDSGETIIAITDKYLITSNSDLYELIDFSDKISKLEGVYAINHLPILKLEYKNPLSTDRVIIVYEFDDPNWNNPCFYGKLGTPKYSNRHHNYSFRLENFGREDLTREIDDVAAAEEIATTVINQINNNSKYIYTDATATPALSVNNTNEWVDSQLRHNLYTLRILGNAFSVFEANGYTYFRKWSNKVVQAQYYFNKPDYFKKNAVGTTSTDINWVDTDGSAASCTVTIIAELNNHKKVLELSDQNAAGSCNIDHNLTLQADHIIELYIAKDSIAAGTTGYLYLYESIDLRINLNFDANDLKTLDAGGGGWTVIKADFMLADTFVHIKLILDDSANTFDIYINEVNEGTFDYVANSATGVNKIKVLTESGHSGFKFYITAPGETADSEYSVGDNLKGAFHKAGDVGAPSPKRVQEQYNTWKIYVGWDASTNKPFEKELTDAEHIQQYGPLKWKGRTQFTEAKTQAACDAIATALNAWQGMQDNPDDVIIPLMGYEFVGVGKSFIFTWDHYLGDTYLLSTTTTYIIAKNRVNFITGEQILTLSTNIVSRGASI